MKKNNFTKIFGIALTIIIIGLIGYVIGYEEGRLESNLTTSEIEQLLDYDKYSEPSTDAPEEPAPQAKPNLPSIEIISISTRATEKNNSWHRYAWILELKNNTNSTISRDADFQWLDSEGFVIDTDREYDLLIPANQEKTFRGDVLINTPGAHSVESISVSLRY